MKESYQRDQSEKPESPPDCVVQMKSKIVVSKTKHYITKFSTNEHESFQFSCNNTDMIVTSHNEI